MVTADHVSCPLIVVNIGRGWGNTSLPNAGTLSGISAVFPSQKSGEYINKHINYYIVHGTVDAQFTTRKDYWVTMNPNQTFGIPLWKNNNLEWTSVYWMLTCNLIP